MHLYACTCAIEDINDTKRTRYEVRRRLKVKDNITKDDHAIA